MFKGIRFLSQITEGKKITRTTPFLLGSKRQGQDGVIGSHVCRYYILVNVRFIRKRH